MSVENGKVCCNCRHNIRIPKQTYIECYCDIDNHYIGYIECMEGWCRHWAKERKNKEKNNMLGFISKKKLYKKIKELYKNNDTEKIDGKTTGDRKTDYYFNAGCANVCNALCSYFGLPRVDKRGDTDGK